MIKLIVGLGNPGRQYHLTRHNAGFLFLDALAAEAAGPWSSESSLQASLCHGLIGGRKVLLAKPETYMNLSGLAVGKAARYYKLSPEEILVVHDELDFPLGVVKLKYDGGAAGHNGLKDIIAHLGSKAFYRLRIGIGRPEPGRETVHFVLSAMPQNDRDIMFNTFKTVRPVLDCLVAGDMAAAMNKLNTCA